MRASELVKELQFYQSLYGEDVEVQLQNDPCLVGDIILSNQFFYVIPEEYEDGWYINLRNWPY